jgi:hypothetical protein
MGISLLSLRDIILALSFALLVLILGSIFRQAGKKQQRKLGSS